ncbi:MAG: hypothetical protein WCK53_12845 [Methanomicrobiales archaeon]
MMNKMFVLPVDDDMAVLQIGKEFPERDRDMPMEYLRKQKDLFKPCFLSNPESQCPYTGIGLAIVQKIICRHDGSLRPGSTFDCGTTVFSTFNDGGLGPPGRPQ